MADKRRLKFALLAATALAAGAAHGVHAAQVEAPAVVIEAASPVHVAADETAPVSPALRNAGIAAVLTGAFAALIRLIGVDRLQSLFGKAAPVAAKAARAVASAPVSVARAAGRAAASPFRFLLIFAGLGLFALTGIGMYDVEWLGGLVAGAAAIAFMWYSAAKTRRVFARRRSTQPASGRKSPGISGQSG